MCSQINEFVKRARAAKIHSYIMGHLKKEMPAMMGKQKAQQRLIDNLEDEFAKVLLQFDKLFSSWMLLLWRFCLQSGAVLVYEVASHVIDCLKKVKHFQICIWAEWVLVLVVACFVNRSKESIIYQLEISQMWTITKRRFLATTLTNLRNWNPRWCRQWMTCWVMTFRSYSRSSGIHMITRDRYMQLSILGFEEGSRLSHEPCEGVIGYISN